MSEVARRGSPKLHRRFVLLLFVLATFSGGCSFLGTPLSPLFGKATPWASLPNAAAVPTLDPQFQYLRVTQGQQVGWLVYGGVQATPWPGLEAWYGADGGVLRLLQGRLVGYASAALQWSETRSTAPALTAGGFWSSTDHLDFERWVDRMPGWHLNESQHRRLTPMGSQAPAEHRFEGSTANLVWWRETAPPHNVPNNVPNNVTDNLPNPAQALMQDAWFAIDPHAQPPRVIYGQQCLLGSQPLVCLSWQRWPAQAQPAPP